MCTQYADKCPPEFITNWTTPLQQQSIQDFIDAGVPQVSAAACMRSETPGVSPTGKTVFGRPCHCLLALGFGLGLVGTVSSRR